MVVLIVTAVKPGLRGELTRWMIEPQAGVFVGNLSGRVRDRLWEKVESEVLEGYARSALFGPNGAGIFSQDHTATAPVSQPISRG